MFDYLNTHAEFLRWLIPIVVATGLGIGIPVLQKRWNEAAENRLKLREQNAEKRLKLREEDAEERLIKREQKELERRTWQELGAALLRLHYLISTFRKNQAYIQANNDQLDTTTRATMFEFVTQMHRNMYKYFHEWTGAATLLKVLPEDGLTANVRTAMLKFGWAKHAEFSQITEGDMDDFLILIKLINEEAKIRR